MFVVESLAKASLVLCTQAPKSTILACLVSLLVSKMKFSVMLLTQEFSVTQVGAVEVAANWLEVQ